MTARTDMGLDQTSLLIMCATVFVGNARAEGPQQAPLVDHHQHLWSPSAYAATTTPTRSVISLPGSLGRLLKRRDGAPRKLAAARHLYTTGAAILGTDGELIVGGDKILESLKEPYRELLPLAFEVSNTSAYIIGSAAQKLGSSTIYSEHFLLSLTREQRGEWKIAAESWTRPPPRVTPETITAEMLVRALDEARVRRAVVLAAGYWLANRFVTTEMPHEYEQVKAENNWAVEQANHYPDRLVTFCGVNPLRTYATTEVERCAHLPTLRGVKLHFANSGVDLTKPDHVSRVRRVFEAANRNGLAIVAHVWVPGRYGSEQSRILLEQLLPAAPDVTVQIAHLAGTGPGYFNSTDLALAPLAEAIARGDPAARRLIFDVASNVTDSETAETLSKIASRLRQIGIDRIVFGSDAAASDPSSIARAWASFRRLPLTEEEFLRVARNEAPYFH